MLKGFGEQRLCSAASLRLAQQLRLGGAHPGGASLERSWSAWVVPSLTGRGVMSVHITRCSSGRIRAARESAAEHRRWTSIGHEMSTSPAWRLASKSLCVLLLGTGLSGCGTIAAKSWGGEWGHYYAGVQCDMRLIRGIFKPGGLLVGALTVVDLPFTLAADTLVLPIDLFIEHNHDFVVCTGFQ